MQDDFCLKSRPALEPPLCPAQAVLAPPDSHHPALCPQHRGAYTSVLWAELVTSGCSHSLTHSLTHIFSKYLVSTYHVGDTAIN